ncbi:MAG: endonuclease/exonuclease/phosphatase family protein [Pseudomonadota bacterium]
MQRDGPGLLLRDIIEDDAADIAVAVAVIAKVGADVIVLSGMDYDAEGHALTAFAEALGQAGAIYPHRFAAAPNAGQATGLDLDGDGRVGTPRDAQGYGRFAGQGGMAVLSNIPIAGVRDHSDLLWHALPENLLAGDTLGTGAVEVQRLSSKSHWIVSLAPEAATPFELWAFHATPPVFDGPEDRNGRRNHDEAAFWLRHLEGAFGARGEAPFILLGDANLDPLDGDGRPEALRALLSHPALQDPRPASAGGIAAAREGGANAVHRGDPALDTVNWRDDGGGPGNLRVDYVLPSAAWRVVGTGVFWPGPDDPKAKLLGGAGDGATRHRLVWVDLVLKGAP